MFAAVGSTTATELALVGRPAGEQIYRVVATLPSGTSGSNLEAAQVEVGSPREEVPDAPFAALFGLSTAGLLGLLAFRRRRLMA